MAARSIVIGILGGIGSASTAEYYTSLIEHYVGAYGDYYCPEIVVYSLDFQHFTDLENSGDTAAYLAYIMRGITRLERAGADLIIMAANSPHAVFDSVAEQTRVQLLSIVEVTAQAAKRHNLHKVLLLGIKFTMQADFYPKRLNELGIEVVVPSEKHQDEIEAIIFGELVVNIEMNSPKQRLLDIIQDYEVDGVILGCTELPLIIEQEDVGIPTLDTLQLHVEATLQYVLADK